MLILAPVLVLGAPLAFEPHEGHYLARTRHSLVRLTPTAAVFEKGRLEFLGASPGVSVEGVDRLPATVHRLIGRDPRAWHAGIPTYSRVLYRDLYPGIDLVFYGNQEHLEFDFLVSPGADPNHIRLRTSPGFQLEPPRIYQEGRPVVGAFQPIGPITLGFSLGGYDPARPLVIDPVVRFSTYLGGGSNDLSRAVATDADGNVYVAGRTDSPDFPTRDPYQPSPRAFSQVFVAKFAADGSLVYSTYVGGSENDAAWGIAVDRQGAVYVTGNAQSKDFPVTNSALQPQMSGAAGPYAIDAFVFKLNPAGSALEYSTYLGGTRHDFGEAIAVDAQGNAYVTGRTESRDFPTTSESFQPQHSNGFNEDGFVVKLDASGSRFIYSTYLGGSDGDIPWAIAVDRAGNAVVAGETRSADFPLIHDLRTPGVTVFSSRTRAFVTRLNAGGSELLYSTFLGDGGTGSAQGVAVDPAGNAYIAGSTTWAGLPSSTTLQPYLSGAIYFRSSEGNQTWQPRRNGLTASAVLTLAANPTNRSNVFAGSPEGVFRSEDGGETWTPRGLAGFNIGFLTFDPTNPSLLYAGAGSGEGHHGGLFKTSDAGATWTPINNGIVLNLQEAITDAIAVDPRSPDTLYALLRYPGIGTGGAVYKSADGGGNWTLLGPGIGTTPVALAIDPGDSTLYVATLSVSSRTSTFPGSVYKSADGGATWQRTSLQADLRALVLIPGAPSVLCAAGDGIYCSSDRGATWSRESDASVTLLTADPRVPGALYAGSFSGRVWRSLDAGESWMEVAGIPSPRLVALNVDPLTAELRAGSIAPSDAFLVKLDPRGDLVYSTFFGGPGWDAGEAVAVDPAGNVYLAGSTTADFDPPRQAEAFLAKLPPNADRLLYATLLGSTRRDLAFEPVRGLAVDPRGNAYVVGVTDAADFPTVRPAQSQLQGATDVFVVQVSDAEVSPPPEREQRRAP